MPSTLTLGGHSIALPAALGCLRAGVLPHLTPETIKEHLKRELGQEEVPLLLPLSCVAKQVGVFNI